MLEEDLVVELDGDLYPALEDQLRQDAHQLVAAARLQGFNSIQLTLDQFLQQ